MIRIVYITMMGGEKKKKFLITMIIIIACATMVNYALYNILNTYVLKPSDTYGVVQMNIITVVVIIGAVTVIMFVLIPKENVNELILNMDSGGEKTPEQQLQDMIDEELEK